MEPCVYRGMKMDNAAGKEQDIFVKHVIHQFMKDQLKERKEEKQEDNNSFVFLEKSTLNMVLTYLFMNGVQRTHGEVNEDSHEKILEELDQIIKDNKKEFEKVIALLKEKF